METLLQLTQGSFELQRLPYRPKELLRAWDAADEYLLNTLAKEIKPSANAKILIFNDNFGALAVALHEFKPYAVSDSYLSQASTRLNLAANQLAENEVTLLNSLQTLSGHFDYVLIKAPKTLAFLEDFLIRLQPFISNETQIIVAGMVKGLPSSVWKLLEKLIGETTTSLAKKKARLIFAKPNPQREIPALPYPVYYQLENTNYTVCNHANVFSRDSLDIGTRFLLANLPYQPQAKNIVDLGCGNGIVGLMLAEKHPQAMLHFVDESFMAVDSAKQTFNQAFNHQREAQFYITDALSKFAADSMDLIICNPPFHQQNTVGDHIALTMFTQARKVLKKGGQFWVIGNRHLGYHSRLKKYFSESHTVAANKKFVIISAIK
ncbi:MAG: methyltransferase [Methylococcaceae bacterium]|nr:methyltransferase [Methylococcaceae bacterium]